MDAAVMGERLERKCRAAYELGQDSKTRGLFRVSPFYESPIEDLYFYGGFDGDGFDWVTAKMANKYAEA